MILLRPDYLVFELPSGDTVPCSATEVAAELVSEAEAPLDPQMLKNAAAAVVHYFRVELGRSAVRIEEFTLALKKALSGLGFEVTESVVPSSAIASTSAATPSSYSPMADPVGEVLTQTDLVRIESSAGELSFYPSLREDLRLRLLSSPRVLAYSGLRDCAKRLCASKRWTGRCQQVSDEIVDFLRACLRSQPEHADCLLRIQ